LGYIASEHRRAQWDFHLTATGRRGVIY
jgi:hypothetical protein